MKKLKEKRMWKLRILAGIILLFVAGISFATSPEKALGVISATAIVVGSVTLEGKEAEMYTALMESIKKEVDKHNNGYITETKMLETIAAKINESKIKIADEEDFKALKTAMESLGLVVKGLQESGKAPISGKSLGQQWKEHVTGEGKESWDRFKSQNSGEYKVTLKVAANMLPSTNYTGTLPAAEREAGLTDVAREQRFIINMIGTSPTTSPTIEFVEKKNPDGTASFVLDTEAFTQIDFDLDVNSSTAKDVGGFITVHENMINDIDYIAGEIDRELTYQVMLEADKKVLSGDGLNANLKGITVFAAAGFSLTSISVVDPNLGDCISASIRQIEILGFNTGASIMVVLNPADYEQLLGTKDKNGQYVKHPLLSPDGTTFAGYPISRTSFITAGQILVFDRMKVYTKVLQGITLATGYNLTGEFTKRLLTVRAYMRLHNYIKDNDTTSFVYDSIADIKAAITAT